MDNFREWLSDNLRYILLGVGVLIIFILLSFGAKACIGQMKGGSTSDNKTTKDQRNVPSSPKKDGETDEKKDANPMEKNNEKLVALMKEYYSALGAKDINKLKELEENFPVPDEEKIKNSGDEIQGYEVKDVYSLPGLTKDSYVVFVNFEYICKGITTKVPALSQLYVVKNSKGELQIDGSAQDNSDIIAYTDKLRKQKNVTELVDRVSKEYDEVLAKDENLSNFLKKLGEADSNVQILVATNDANIRSEASQDSEVIGTLPQGSEVKELGQEGDYIKVDYNGIEGYVHNSLLQGK